MHGGLRRLAGKESQSPCGALQYYVCHYDDAWVRRLTCLWEIWSKLCCSLFTIPTLPLYSDERNPQKV